MDWINIKDALPPHMEPVAVKEYAFPWESEDDERAYVTCYNVLYNREMGVWLVKDPSGSGKYTEQDGTCIRKWALM